MVGDVRLRPRHRVTGASIMRIYQSDLRTMMGPVDPIHVGLPPRIGETSIMGITGHSTCSITMIEVTHLDPATGLRMTPWTRVTTAVANGAWSPSVNSPRLDASVLRYLLYMASALDGKSNLFLSTCKSRLQKLPKVDMMTVTGPPEPPLPPLPQGSSGFICIPPPTFPIPAAPKVMPDPTPGVR